MVFYKAQLMVSKLIQAFPWMEIAEFDPSWLKNLNCLSFDLMFLLFVLKSTKNEQNLCCSTRLNSWTSALSFLVTQHNFHLNVCLILTAYTTLKKKQTKNI